MKLKKINKDEAKEIANSSFQEEVGTSPWWWVMFGYNRAVQIYRQGKSEKEKLDQESKDMIDDGILKGGNFKELTAMEVDEIHGEIASKFNERLNALENKLPLDSVSVQNLISRIVELEKSTIKNETKVRLIPLSIDHETGEQVVIIYKIIG